MKSLHLTSSTPVPVLIEREVPVPVPGPGEVLIRVRAAGITPTEVIWSPTTHTKSGGPRSNAVLSHEFSGEIAGLGEGIQGVAVGDSVYGMNDWFAEGALAEYCVTRPEWIAPTPKSLTHAEAASVPIGALTAWQGLMERANLKAGERVLIHGGAGSVGVFAIQFARSAGAKVVTTVSARNFDLARSLGANEVLDYHAAPFETVVRDIDVVFDTVGGETLQRSMAVLKPGGRLITIAAGSEIQFKDAFFIVEPARDQLAMIAGRIDRGELRPVVDSVLPFSQAADAIAGRAPKTGRGKIVVTIP